MSETNYAGIDYGMGLANVDNETGIRFGVIPWTDLGPDFDLDTFETDWGDPTCPHCGSEVIDHDSVAHAGYETSRGYDNVCTKCELALSSDECFNDDPAGYDFTEEGYVARMGCGDNDIFITKSPYFTHAQFCSPCAPGAGHLGNPCPDGPKTYCFGHDWFENDVAPYPVYRVDTGELVTPPVK